MLTIHARRYDNLEPVRVTVVGERIVSVDPVWPVDSCDDWPLIAPGVFDLQINGQGGIWFSDTALTPDKVLTVLDAHFQYGIARMCPTLVTNSFEALEAGLQAIDAACRQEPWAERMVAGCHLEGPYISPVDGPRGAHPLEHVRGCDWDEFARLQKASGNRIRLLTLAADAEGAVPFIKQATAEGVVIAIGHTAADSEQIAAAVDAGASLSTHLGNGAHGTIRRHPNYIWDQLGDARLWASIITDGHHLPPAVVRSIVKVKGPLRTIITCDASGLAGCAPGEYEYHGGRFEVLDSGAIVIAGQRQILAGSGHQTDVCIGNAVTMGAASLPEAWHMASQNPARLLGREIPGLARGRRADLTLFRFDGRVRVEATIASGELRFGEIPEFSVAV